MYFLAFFFLKGSFNVKYLYFKILTAAKVTVSELPPKMHAEVLYLKGNFCGGEEEPSQGTDYVSAYVHTDTSLVKHPHHTPRSLFIDR